ncbi:enhancer of polycomb [Culex quinquefasciatus]|uniref:Enhancer of polycomb n=1 Tax=Culex quinquefasciatus TaxID=7176 RepID=B0WSE2_CULQU|nr:enhancer of polycomb [Culex quinquefasciatus]|eukprot:XP_001870670.1 enhancer of polycomb [Culex quinquefasciatus]
MLKPRRDLSRAMTLLEMINGARRLRANSCTSASRFRRSGTRRRTLSARCWAEFTSNATKVSRLVPQSGRRSSQIVTLLSLVGTSRDPRVRRRFRRRE